MTSQMTGAKMVVQALKDQGVDTVFGYPGGAVLPIYDEIFQQNEIKHILVRHEQGAVEAAAAIHHGPVVHRDADDSCQPPRRRHARLLGACG